MANDSLQVSKPYIKRFRKFLKNSDALRRKDFEEFISIQNKISDVLQECSEITCNASILSMVAMYIFENVSKNDRQRFMELFFSQIKEACEVLDEDFEIYMERK